MTNASETQAAAPTDDRGDPGLFGPGSITWRVHADQILWVGGLRALYLQALHPEAVRGIFTHSDYKDDPWGRLFRTADYVGVVTFGSRRRAAAAGARVRGVHDGLGLNDPHLMRWVHCCEVGSFLDTFRRAGGGLTDAEADRYLTEQVAAAELVGLDPDTVPDSVARLDAYFERMLPELSGTPEAREVARFLLVPPMPTKIRLLTPALPAWVALSGLAFATQPGWARRLYGLPSVRLADVAVGLQLRAIRLAVQRLPEKSRTGPHLRAAQIRMGLREPS